MSGKITTGIELWLKDKFSQGISKAASAGKNFGDGFLNAASNVDKALSGITGKLATIGVSMGAAATINKTIDFEDKLTRLGTTAGATSDEMKKLKKEIFDAAMKSDIKMNPDEIVSAMDIIMTKTGNMKFAKANIENMGRAMQALNVGGAEVGGMMAEFDKLGYKAEEITELLDIMYTQGNMGAFTAAEFAKNGSAIVSAYSKIGTSSKDLANANAAMQILTMGTKDPTAAVTTLESLMQELADPAKQEKLAKLGKALGMDLNVRDANGQFRDLTELMPQIVAAGQKMGNMDALGTIFGGVSMRGIAAFDTYGDKLEGLLELGDTTNALSKASAKNADTLKSNITNLQTAFTAVANAGLDVPLRALASALNSMAKHPAILKAVFATLIAGIGGVMAMKGIGKIVNLVNSFKGLKSGKLSIDMLGGGSGAANGTPVFVTNMGQGGFGAAGGMDMSFGGMPKGQGAKLSGRQIAGASGAAALGAAITAVPAMIGELKEINNSELKGKEKSKAQGGAIGGAVGTVAGAAGGVAAGAAVGAAVGSVVPILGTAVGALVGAGIGLFGAWAGRKAGEAIGEAVGKDEIIPESAAVKEELQTVQQLPHMQPTATLEGQAGIDVNVTLTDEKTQVSTAVRHNDAPFVFNTGSIREARSLAY